MVKRLVGKIESSDLARDTILISTLEMIAEYGIEGLTIKRVSDRLNMSTGIIYHHYQTKENLLYEAFFYFVHRSHNKILGYLRVNDDPENRLMEFVNSQFSEEMITVSAANIWVYFWYYSLQDEKVAHLLTIFSKRFVSNISYAFFKMTNNKTLSQRHALEFFSLIHGLWIEHVITGVIKEPQQAVELLREYIQGVKKK